MANAQSLDFYLKKGLENSPLLKEFNNQLLSGTLDSLLTSATYKPQINQVSQALYAPAGKNIGYEEAITNGGNFSALVNLVQPLLNKRIKESQFRDISLSNQAIGVNAKLTETDLKLGITAQYLTAYADYRQIQFIQSTLNLLKEEQEILKSLVDQGIYLQTDRMNMALAITTQEIAIKQGMIQYRLSCNDEIPN
ncbi:MAG: TolC family protein [Bacteroidia bacterium]|nr:TolC family protein [Bacteroidia bacterium]